MGSNRFAEALEGEGEGEGLPTPYNQTRAMPPSTPPLCPPLHLTDSLGKVPLDTIRLMASKDQNAGLELFRRRLGYLCQVRINQRRREKELVQLISSTPREDSSKLETLHKELKTIQKELNQ